MAEPAAEARPVALVTGECSGVPTSTFLPCLSREPNHGRYTV